MQRFIRWVPLFALALAACGDDSGPADAVVDAGAADAAPAVDGGNEDASAPDAGPNGGLCDGVDCSSLDEACLVGVCDPTSGQCVAEARPDDTACDDGDLCTTGSVCAAAVCLAGAPVDCSELDGECAVGVCNATNGLCEPENRPDDTACDDGNLCTSGSVCQAGECAAGAALDCSGLDGACVVGVCDPDTGMCETENLPDATICDDGDLCTTGESCLAGQCSAGSPVDCSSLDGICVVGACDPADGQCVASNRPDGTLCTDGDACTLGDVCAAGLCVPTDAVDCSGLDGACVVGVCDASDGTCATENLADGTTCSDANACTTGDSCLAGNCTSTGVLDCSGLDGTCVVGVCDAVSGCVAETAPVGSPCSDGNQCTTMEMCDSAGLCLGQLGGCGPGVLADEDFDGDDGDFTTGGTSSSWAWGLPAGTFISAEDPGDFEWVTNLSGSYNNSEDSWLESPSYDFGPFTQDPILEFSHIYQTETSFDFGWVETSTDGGATWLKLGVAGGGVNWYNQDFNDTWDGSSGSAGVRRTAGAVMAGFAGLSDVRIRFRMDSDGTVAREGFSVDDFTIREAEIDLAVDSLTLPVAGCGVVAGPITVVISNPGGVAQSNFDVSVTGIGGAAITETVSDTVPALGTLTYTFNATMNVSAQSTVTVTVNASGDTDATNDAISQQSGIPLPQVTVSSLNGYLEDFEAGSGDWRVEGTNPSWARGAPTGPFITGAASGTNAYVTNLSGAYNNLELSYLVSPCLDLSGFTADPVLAFSHIFETESCCDETWVETSTDAGATWTKLGRAGAGTNWYNDASNQWWDGTSGAAGTWRVAQTTLEDAAGLSDFRLRIVMSSDGSITRDGVGIDDVEIYAPSTVDLTVDSVSLPPPTCGSVAGSVSAVIRNLGGTPQSNFSISATGFGGGTVNETVTQTVPALGSLTYTFATLMNVTSAGTVTVTVNLTGDTNSANDSASETATPVPTVVIGPTGSYSEGFESGPGDWTVEGANASWAIGTPSGTFITGASLGTEAAVTNLSGNYNNSELSYLTSPCFDFSGLSADPTLAFDHIFETESCCDETWVETSTTGGDTWTKLGTSGTGTNWYNDAVNDWWDGSSGMSGVWRGADNVMTGAAGSDEVRVRFVMSTDGSVTEDGVGVDEVSITP